MVPPSERRNETSELAAPMLRRSTVFCTASTRFCMDMPTPRPSTTRNPQISRIGVVWSIVDSSASPVVISTAPVTRNGFHRP